MTRGRPRGWLRHLSDDESGAVTIDWVALTAGVLLMGILVIFAIFNGGVASLTGNINQTLVAAALAPAVGPAPDYSGPGGGSGGVSGGTTGTSGTASTCTLSLAGICIL